MGLFQQEQNKKEVGLFESDNALCVVDVVASSQLQEMEKTDEGISASSYSSSSPKGTLSTLLASKKIVVSAMVFVGIVCATTVGFYLATGDDNESTVVEVDEPLSPEVSTTVVLPQSLCTDECQEEAIDSIMHTIDVDTGLTAMDYKLQQFEEYILEKMFEKETFQKNDNGQRFVVSRKSNETEEKYEEVERDPYDVHERVECRNGKALNYPCRGFELLSITPPDKTGFGNSIASDMWAWVDPKTQKEYALLCFNHGLSVIDVSDPLYPMPIAYMNSTGNTHKIWHDVKTYKNHAFVVSEGTDHGMQVLDLTRLRDIQKDMVFGDKPVEIQPDTLYSEFGTAHNIAINEESGYAYGVGTKTCKGGLHFVNIQEPKSPVFEGCFSADNFTHDAQIITYNGPDTDYLGQEITFAYNEDTLTIVDVTDKADPVIVSRTSYNNSGYTHQGWTFDNHQYLLLNDELDEMEGKNDGFAATFVWDISSLENPFQTSVFKSPTKAIDHNLYITEDGLAYCSNYASGLRILNTKNVNRESDTWDLEEVAYFDVDPTTEGVIFGGTWSNYPYLPSGNILVSAFEKGLVVLKLRLDLNEV